VFQYRYNKVKSTGRGSVKLMFLNFQAFCSLQMTYLVTTQRISSSHTSTYSLERFYNAAHVSARFHHSGFSQAKSCAEEIHLYTISNEWDLWRGLEWSGKLKSSALCLAHLCQEVVWNSVTCSLLIVCAQAAGFCEQSPLDLELKPRQAKKSAFYSATYAIILIRKKSLCKVTTYSTKWCMLVI